MRDAATTAQQQQTTQRGLLAGIVTLPFRLFGVLCASLLLSIAIECIGMYFFWQDEGWRHAQTMFDSELDQLSSDFTRSALVQEPGQTARRVVTAAHEWVFVKSGLLEWMQGASTRASAPSRGGGNRAGHDLRYYLSQVYVWAESYLIAAAFTTLTFLVRVLVLVFTLPLFLLAAFVGLVDGLVRRDIRKFGAGRESGFVYHRAKAALMPLAVLPWVVYLSLPVSVHPLGILLPGAALLGMAMNIAVASFKKYL